MRSAISRIHADLDSAQEFLNDFRRDHEFIGLAFRHAARLLAANRANVAFQVADARLARVVTDDVSHTTLAGTRSALR